MSSRWSAILAILSIAATGCPGGNDSNGSGNSSSDGGGVSSSDGGIELAGVGSVTFEPGALPAGATVVLEKGTDAVTLAAFDDGAGNFAVQDRIRRRDTPPHTPELRIRLRLVAAGP